MSPSQEEWTATFVERVGGMEEAEEIYQRFSELIAESKTEVVMTKWGN